MQVRCYKSTKRNKTPSLIRVQKIKLHCKTKKCTQALMHTESRSFCAHSWIIISRKDYGSKGAWKRNDENFGNLMSLRIVLFSVRSKAVSYINIPVLFVQCIPKVAIFFFEVFFKSQIHLLLFRNRMFHPKCSSRTVKDRPWTLLFVGLSLSSSGSKIFIPMFSQPFSSPKRFQFS